MAAPTQEEREAIAGIFREELAMFASRDPARRDAFIDKYYSEDVLGVHAHHSNHPLTHRLRDHEDPVDTLRDYYAGWFGNYKLIARAVHTLVWLDVKEQGDAWKVAVAALVYEGYQSRYQRSRRRHDQQYDPRYCHLTVYFLRHPAPFDNRHWRIHSGIGGLKAEGYSPKLDPREFAAHNRLRRQQQPTHEQLHGAVDPKEHAFAFLDETHHHGANPDFYFGWDVVVNGVG